VGECSGKTGGIRLAYGGVILAAAAAGERYRLGHYGAITKVPRGNVAGKGMLLSLRAASHVDEGTEGLPRPLFSGSTATGIWLREG
jgi:hypothetical protein